MDNCVNLLYIGWKGSDIARRVSRFLVSSYFLFGQVGVAKRMWFAWYQNFFCLYFWTLSWAMFVM